MAEADYYLCDVCKARVEKHNRVMVPTGYGKDNVDIHSPSDLCPTHAAEALRELATQTIDSYKHFNRILATIHEREAERAERKQAISN